MNDRENRSVVVPLPTDRDVRFGDDAILGAGSVAAELGGRRAVLVCGQQSFESSGASRCLDGLREAVEVRRWSEFGANTDAADLIEGLRVVDEVKPDLILGVGGGSAMDMTKLLCAYRGITGEDELHTAIRRADAVAQRDTRMVLAPTTSGSGSEATRFAVVYIGQKKFSIAGDAMLPDAVILDPRLTLSASPYQRATSGIDAVAQATESLWAANGDDASRGFARQALALLIPALPEFVNRPDSEVAAQMAEGSHLAGRAIDVSRTTAAHAVSYGFTKSYGVSHGHAVALTLGQFIEAHAAPSPRLQPAIEPAAHAAVMRDILDAFGARTGTEGKQRFAELAHACGLSLSLGEIGVTTGEQVDDLAGRVNVERLGNNPVAFTVAELIDLIGQNVALSS